ncbi:MAG: hypothetical protein ACI82Q_001562 [Nonlabens sp.]|jgi:hypothetical protein
MGFTICTDSTVDTYCEDFEGTDFCQTRVPGVQNCNRYETLNGCPPTNP